MKKNTSKKIFIVAMLAWPLLHWAIFTLYMNIQTVVYSVQRFNYYIGDWQFVKFKNYSKLFDYILTNTDNFGIAFRNTFLWLGLNVFVIIPIALVVAYFLTKKIPLYRFFSSVFFIPNIISIVVLTMAWSFMWHPTQGVVNSILDIIGLGSLKQTWLGNSSTALGNVFLYCVWAGIGWNNLILSGAIGKIPKEILEASELDGVTNVQEFFHIIIPSIWPTIVTVVIIGAAAAFRVFLQPQLLTNGQYGTTSVPLRVVETVTEDSGYGLASAAGLTIAVLGFIAVYIIKSLLDRLGKKWE